jgi:hypothetical protein
VAILVAIFAASLMLPLCAISVDIARWYVEIERVQNAADAAATAGVTYLPDDLASATSTAISVSGRNGYPDSGNSSVSVSVGEKPTQLVVTVTSKITNSFASSFGSRFTTLSRSATADYNGPAPMGSPCNAFGNEPSGAVPTGIRGPSNSVIATPSGGAACTSNPQFWGAIAGPETAKANGDARMTRHCGGGTDGCTGTTNNEFNAMGYFYIVRVGAAAVNTPVTLQVYDPAWVENGDTCNIGPVRSTAPNSIPFRDNMNSYTPTDGVTRYNPTPNTFCTGDTMTAGTTTPIITSYGLRKPTDTYRPSMAEPLTGCERQYPGYVQGNGTPKGVSTGTLAETLADGTANPNYQADLAKVYHQWVELCTFTPTQTGDYYLQVRTNVALGGASDGEGGYTGNDAVFTQTGDDTSVGGSGNNRFSLRVKAAQAGAVSVAGWQTMSLFANYSGASSTFNLVRVIPAGATKTLNIRFFDVGDASQPGTISVLSPQENGGTIPSGCRGSGVVNGPLTSCELTNVKSATYNGRTQIIRVPIPTNYTCNSTQSGGCWFQLRVAFPGGVTDTTTWSASIDGDPIRMIK